MESGNYQSPTAGTPILVAGGSAQAGTGNSNQTVQLLASRGRNANGTDETQALTATPGGALLIALDHNTQKAIRGPQGPQGNTGPDSTVPGPQGPQGPAGMDSTVPGPQGPQGPQGP